MGILGNITDLEGTWLAVEANVAGRPEPKIAGQLLTVAGNHFRIVRNCALLYGGGITTGNGTEPGAVDFDQCETDTLSGIWRGIYRRDGDAVEICDNAVNMESPRPTGFEQRNDDDYVWVRFERQP